MGRLRTATHTLAALELPPDELMGHLNDIVAEIGPDAYATCLYALYDATTGTCTVVRAGHPPPLVVHPDGRTAYPDIPDNPPLGGAQPPFETAELALPAGTLLLLFTDGLVESPQRDLDEGMDELARLVEGADRRDLDRLADLLVERLLPGGQPVSDDAALLVGRLHALPRADMASWRLPDGPRAAGEARRHVREQLATWHLDELTVTTELLASELVGNVVRHAKGPIGFRLLRTGALVCEVSDASLTMPRIRRASETDEGGRGLQLVSVLAERWGSRFTSSGKTSGPSSRWRPRRTRSRRHCSPWRTPTERTPCAAWGGRGGGRACTVPGASTALRRTRVHRQAVRRWRVNPHERTEARYRKVHERKPRWRLPLTVTAGLLAAAGLATVPPTALASSSESAANAPARSADSARQSAFARAAAEYRVPLPVLLAVAHHESRGRPRGRAQHQRRLRPHASDGRDAQDDGRGRRGRGRPRRPQEAGRRPRPAHPGRGGRADRPGREGAARGAGGQHPGRCRAARLLREGHRRRHPLRPGPVVRRRGALQRLRRRARRPRLRRPGVRHDQDGRRETTPDGEHVRLSAAPDVRPPPANWPRWT